tara:strand:- start:71 stop:316 length:246 start_codon:yes stop_codon:yes gene_type:complete
MTERKETDLTWYVKWASSIVLMLGMILTSQNIFPYNLYVHFIGLLGWLYVSIVWNDRALIVVNSVALSIFTNGIVSELVKG